MDECQVSVTWEGWGGRSDGGGGLWFQTYNDLELTPTRPKFSVMDDCQASVKTAVVDPEVCV